MSTVEVEVLRKEAREKEKREIEELRQKYKQRQNQKKPKQTTDPEKQALIQQAQEKEQQEKEQIRQKLKQRQKLKNKTPTNTTNPEKQALIQQAQQKEQQEKEQIRQKYKQRQKLKNKTPTNTTIPEKQVHKQYKKQENKHRTTQKILEKEDLYKKALNIEVIENDDIWERFLIKKSKKNAERFNQLEKSYENALESDGIESEKLESEGVNSERLEMEGLENKGLESENLNVNKLDGETEDLETVDRSALLAKYNIKDVQEDEVTTLLENFDSSITDENVEEIEERLMETIKQSTLSHPKIEWVNVLVFLDENQMSGNIKILAEYDDRNLLKRIISDNNKKLEVELIQIALYEVWDVFTTLGVNTNDLESKIEVEVELDRA
ncbi:hypothetical protein [Methanobacterium formicicum]|uniref:Uncharacterized protein n=1 Tax=Methanobacterium formicicum (strain DSM 3637 / PP1) TaxID=1204725 RepID=K2RTN0_METFP|nr:hypothetical protein [Methanobacterium formicicum]EKF86165.1 hypothetical protein A994_04395 [Methanobacterium formicicum DSM 3637]